MPPKKDKKAQLKSLLEKYEIKFEGPLPPKKWPTPQKHIFRVIQDIWANRYDDYIKRTNIDKRIICKQQERVRELRKKAYMLRDDIDINEGTWRDLVETHVIERFTQDIVCGRCRNENWWSEYEAQPFDPDERVSLERKRRNRRQCNCNDGSYSDRNLNEDSDEENQTLIFNTAVGAAVSHDPEDNLENSKIPMRPDKVIGLSMNDRYRGYIASWPLDHEHCPVRNRQLLYPFLVIEAKRESDAPGFRSVEAQTAFCIRRFLKIQDNLRRARQLNLSPLVWFLAFQGEEWRVYAGTLCGDKVRVFQLWLGTIESQDGALQIFQLVDFIWTWARDIYRPQIRRGLRGHVPDLRGISPTSTNPFSRSQSVFSVSSVRSFSLSLLDSVRGDDITGQEADSYYQLRFLDAGAHPFLRWADHHNVSTEWALQSSMRHSDIVKFSFRIFEFPEDEDGFYLLIHLLRFEDESSAMISLFRHILENRYTFSLSRGHIHEVEKHWTGMNTQTSYERSITNPNQMMKAFFFFRTFCQREDWQLKREMYCIILSSNAVTLLSRFLEAVIDLRLGSNNIQSIQHSELIRSFQQLRNLSGRQSVANALQNINLVLLPSEGGNQIRWCRPQTQWISESIIAQCFALFNSVSCSGNVLQSLHHESGRLLQVLRTSQVPNTSADLLHTPEAFGAKGAVLAMRPDSWPSHCPRFCLFVLLDQDFDDEARLGSLLRYTIEAREMYGGCEQASQAQPLRVGDRNILRSWVNFFKIETTPRS